MAPLEQRLVGALLLAVAADDAGGAEAADGWPSNTHIGWPSTSSTRGTRSRKAAGARLVKRSAGSDQWESASTTNMSANSPQRSQHPFCN